jgi:endo-1,4-beta-xylanase
MSRRGNLRHATPTLDGPCYIVEPLTARWPLSVRHVPQALAPGRESPPQIMRIYPFSLVTLFALQLAVACSSGSNTEDEDAGTAAGGFDGGVGGAAVAGGSSGAVGGSDAGVGGHLSSGGAGVGGDLGSGGGSLSSGGTGGEPETGGSGGELGGGGTGGEAVGSGGSGTGGAEACTVDHGGEIPALGDYYSNHFAVGAAIDTGYNNYAAVLTKHFNSVTAEDQMKFDALQPSEGNFSYGTADQMVNFAVQNGMAVRGHALVWHRQTPSWVFSGTPAQVLSRMKNHIQNVMQHFQGKVAVWDVVNEAIMDDGNFRTNNEEAGQESGWYGALGESYIAEAFTAARAADPSAKLFYNDYYNYHPVRRQAIYNMLSEMIDAGVPIDGVGLQTHLNLEPGTDPNEQSYHQTVENLEEAITMYSSLGLDVQITEMDISVYLRGIQYTPDMFYTPETFTPALQEQQAERYGQFFEMFRSHSDLISSVTFWGISDNNTWLSEFDSGRQDFPLLFDAQLQPKPSFWAVVDFCE